MEITNAAEHFYCIFNLLSKRAYFQKEAASIRDLGQGAIKGVSATTQQHNQRLVSSGGRKVFGKVL